jgi:FAD synthetase
MPTAGILVIGNEILSGKVVDTNSPYLCRELRTLGVDVERIITIPDEIDVIAEHVRAMHETYDLVFTSGGIGTDARRPDDRRHRQGVWSQDRTQRVDRRAARARGGQDAEREPAQDGAGARGRDADRRG